MKYSTECSDLLSTTTRLHSLVRLLLLSAVGLLASMVLAAPSPANKTTPIDQYVAKKDRAYEWELVEIIEKDGYKTALIDFVSQKWLRESEVDRVRWRHRLVVTIPDNLYETDIGFLYIGGGSHSREAAKESSDRMLDLALSTNTITAELDNVPYQPLTFHNDGRARSEDDLIAYAWVQFIGTGDARWLPRGPMVKSAVRAMDTITRFTSRHVNKESPISRFVVAGGSKRGWTTWLTAAVDKRVVGLAPIVIDVLNVDVSMRHHFAAYGFFAPSIGDYVNHRIMLKMGSPELAKLYEYTDPYNYMKRLTVPKLILNATGDQFFLPDSSRFYWDEVPDAKYLRYVPNANHGLGGSDASDSLASFHYHITRNQSLPRMTWKYVGDSQVGIQFVEKPDSLTLWQANNPSARDFRVETLGREFQATSLSTDNISQRGINTYQVDKPEEGWTAWFIEATYQRDPRPIKLTTEVRVTPDTLPFEGKLPNQRTSLTFVLLDVSEYEEQFTDLFAGLSKAIKDTNLGKELSIVRQDDRLYINFVPLVEPQLAYYPVASYLRRQLGEDIQAQLQLESGVGPTLLP